MQNENILKNVIFRMAMQEKNELDDVKAAAFQRSQKQVEANAISLAAKELASSTIGARTLLSKRFIEKNKVS